MKLGLAIVSAAALAVALLAGMVLPKHVVVGRRVVIEAPPEFIFPDVGTLSTWPEWTEWSPRNDPKYDPKPDGPNKLVWTQSQGGAGTQTVTEADPQKGIRYRLEIQGGRYLVEGKVQFTKDGTRTAVTWLDSMSFAHSYWGRYLGAGLDFMLGPMMEKSLLTLKKRSEERALAKGVVAAPAPERVDPAHTPAPGEGGAAPSEAKPAAGGPAEPKPVQEPSGESGAAAAVKPAVGGAAEQGEAPAPAERGVSAPEVRPAEEPPTSAKETSPSEEKAPAEPSEEAKPAPAKSD